MPTAQESNNRDRNDGGGRGNRGGRDAGRGGGRGRGGAADASNRPIGGVASSGGSEYNNSYITDNNDRGRDYDKGRKSSRKDRDDDDVGR